MSAKAHLLAFLNWLSPYSTILSLLFLVGILYAFFRAEKIIHDTKHEDETHGDAHGEGEAGAAENSTEKRWERVRAHIDSERESDWRLAVLEADVLLDEMVTHLGYHGDSLGEKLKSIEQSDFTTLQKAHERLLTQGLLSDSWPGRSASPGGRDESKKNRKPPSTPREWKATTSAVTFCSTPGG